MKEYDNESDHYEENPEIIENPNFVDENNPVDDEKAIKINETDAIPTHIREAEALLKIKQHQNFVYAFIGGLLAVLICATIWAGITVATKYQIGYMAIAVGLIVGLAVRFFGAGVTQKFGFLGASLALLGCLLGNLFSQIAFIAQEYNYGYFETFSYLDFDLIISIMKDSFSPMDLFFYGIAIFEGYKFSFRAITSDVIENNGNSPYFKFRIPLVIIGVIILSFVYIKAISGINGEKTYKYPSGKIMSKGILKNSKEDGEWTFYYESGKLQSEGSFKKGIKDGEWKWYNEDNALTGTGTYNITT